MRWAQLSGETRSAIVFAVVLWSIVAFASVAMALGNPTAINAVIGCSIPGVFITVWAVFFVRDDMRRRQ